MVDRRMSIGTIEQQQGQRGFRRFRRSGGGGMSTRESPTPSAERLTGTAQEREAQISAFRSGGEQAFVREQARQQSVRVQQVAEQRRTQQIAQQRQQVIQRRAVQIREQQFERGDQSIVPVPKTGIIGGLDDTRDIPARDVGSGQQVPLQLNQVDGGVGDSGLGGEKVPLQLSQLDGRLDTSDSQLSKQDRISGKRLPISLKEVGALDLLFTEPSVGKIGKKKTIAGRTTETLKTILFQPFSSLGSALRTEGAKLKGEKFKGAKPLGIGVGGVGELVPRTPLGTIGIIAGAKGLSVAPKIIRTSISGGFGVQGIRGVLNKGLTPEQRVASGIVGVGAGSGAIFEATPFIRGAKSQTIGRLTGQFKRVKTSPEGFKQIELDTSRIGLIKAGSPVKTGQTKDVKLPKTSPLVRGGFEVKKSEKKLFLGDKQTLGTSQIGFFKTGKDIKLEREFFTTPQDPTLKIPVTRESRLGLDSLFAIPKGVEISFGIPKSAQIGLFKGSKVARTEKGGAFKIGKGTELEAIRTTGTITGIKKVGETTIRGQRVDIFEAGLKGGAKNVGKVKIPKSPSTQSISRISGEGLVGSTLGLTTRTRSIIRPIRRTRTTSRVSTPSLASITKIPSTPFTPTSRTPTRRTPTTPRFPTFRIPSLRTPPSRPPTTPRTPPTKPPKIPTFFLPKAKDFRKKRGTFSVEERRFGTFRTIGSGLSLKQAFAVGREKVSGGLGATFRITGRGVTGLRLPKGFRLGKTPQTFVEKRKFRISRRGEKRGLALARRKAKIRKRRK